MLQHTSPTDLSVSRQLAPEEIELKKKEKLLERLKDRIAFREEDMADLRGELERFEAQYSMQVGRLYAEIDEIELELMIAAQDKRDEFEALLAGRMPAIMPKVNHGI